MLLCCGFVGAVRHATSRKPNPANTAAFIKRRCGQYESHNPASQHFVFTSKDILRELVAALIDVIACPG